MSYITKVKIEVTNEVHGKLRDLKGRGETFNEVIARLIEESTKEPSK